MDAATPTLASPLAVDSRYLGPVPDRSPERVLTPEQDARAVRALATFKAKCEAWRAGLPLQQLDTDAWVVDVNAHDSEVV